MELNTLLSESRKKRKKRQRVWAIAGIVLAVVVLLGGALWLMVWSPWVRMDRIVPEGNTSVPDADIVALADKAFAQSGGWLHFLGARNLMAWPSTVPSGVLAQAPRLSAATLSKDYGGHAIVLTVTERQPLAVWCSIVQGTAPVESAPAASSTATTTVAVAPVSADETCYWFDDMGTLFASTFDTEGDLLSAVHDYSQTGLALGGKILPDRFLPNMLSILEVLRASGLRIKEIRLNDLGLEEIQVSTYDGPDIYFSLRFPPDGTLAALQDLMAKPGFGGLQYVDFRTQGRMYYK
jgi:hypothetical protein